MSIEDDYAIPTEIIVHTANGSARRINLTGQARAEMLACSAVVHLRDALRKAREALAPNWVPLDSDKEAADEMERVITSANAAFNDVEHHARVLADHVLRHVII